MVSVFVVRSRIPSPVAGWLKSPVIMVLVVYLGGVSFLIILYRTILLVKESAGSICKAMIKRLP